MKKVQFFLKKSSSVDIENEFDDLCLIEKTTAPCEEQPPDPCMPDCFNDPFEIRREVTFQLTDCPGCSVKVKYTHRIACNTWQDLQILAIDYLTPACESSCSIDEIYHEVLGGIIALNQMNFEPLYFPDCSDIWRVANGGCWGKEILYYKTDGETVREVCRYHPCEISGCCLQRLQVCRLQNDGVSITPIGTVSGVPCPPGQTTTDDEGHIYPCLPSCHWAGEVNGEFGQPITLYGTHKIAVSETENNDKLLCSVKSDFDNYFLNIQMNANYASQSTIKIYNINGNLLLEKSFEISKGINDIKMDISKLNSGVYLYSIIFDGIKLNSDKFVISK